MIGKSIPPFLLAKFISLLVLSLILFSPPAHAIATSELIGAGAKKESSITSKTQKSDLKVSADEKGTKYFEMTPQEFVDHFNELYSYDGEFMSFSIEGDRCNLYLLGEQMNIFLQFLDTTESGIQFSSGLNREKWNKLNFYIATDDYVLDQEYFASYLIWLAFLADTLGADFNTEDFANYSQNIGSEQCPELVYTDGTLLYKLRFYEDKFLYRDHTTIYAASIELIQK